jgi:hypothetical protein
MRRESIFCFFCSLFGLVLCRDSIYNFLPEVLDFIREALLFKGKILFIQKELSGSPSLSKNPSHAAQTILFYSISYFFNASIYETYTLINTQVNPPQITVISLDFVP